MRNLLIILGILIVLVLIGWIKFSTAPGRASITIDTQEIKDDTKAVMDKAKEAAEKAKEGTRDLLNQPANESSPSTPVRE